MDISNDRRAQDLLDSIFRVATELVRGERASLLLRDDATSDFVVARAVGLAEDVQRQVRVKSGEGSPATSSPRSARSSSVARPICPPG